MKLQKLILVVGFAVWAGASFAQNDPIITQSTNTSTSTSTNTSASTSNSVSETTVKSPPPSAIAPAVTVINSDVCSTGYSAAAQTQILGLAFGSTVRDMNCERLKLARSLHDMGMKVAAVSTMCQDRRVWDAMMNAGTPCPVDGKIGAEAKALWDANPDRIPRLVKE